MLGEQQEHRTPEEAQRKLGELIQDVKVAMLTTMTDEGHLRSRPMQSVQRHFDGDLWFFTAHHSGKVEEVQKEHQVNCAFVDLEKNVYVSVSGLANLVTNREKAREYWNPALKAWFPDGLDDPELALLQVRVEEAEYWDTPTSTFVHIAGFVKAVATGQTYQPGENEKVNVT